MKTISFLAFLLAISNFAFSQTTESNPSFQRNELKLNLPMTIFASYPEISYERLLNSDISVGASLGLRVSDGQEYPLKFSLMPHFRWFFGGSYSSLQKVAAGFFIELNSGLFTRDDLGGSYYDQSSGYTEYRKDTKFGAGFGLAVGWKYVSTNNWIGEIYLGGGRDFANSDEGYSRFGISIGKRF
ncbi:MAG: hypothetical protein BGN96_01715 [Bacteroidales bacterium 45-6]|nr:MAG: hypothetical protein BGN96_01715 [Bacteroidales bacterium 45-6]